ncbi:MAG: hypothetical protein EBU90_01280 [Proteobacteria bacterium]|nr:hypothetical protein [Pseudomonadota bacterium]NBP12793.1 hypothetical protein [bacterium]
MNIPEGTDLQDLSIKALMKIIEGAKKHIEDLEKKLKEKDERIKLLCEDWTDDETRIEEMLEPIIGREFIDGNIYCSPGTVGCVEELVKKYNEQKNTLEYFKNLADQFAEEIEEGMAKNEKLVNIVIEERSKKGCWHSIVNIRVKDNGEREIICNNCNEVVEVIAPLFPDKDENI